jgi:hypothetical protein
LGNGVATDAHVDLNGRVAAIFNWPGANTNCYSVTNDGAVDVDSGHGTHVALSAVGNGTVGRGTAPGAQLIFQAVENWAQMKGLCSILYPSGYYLVGIPSDIRQLFQQAYNAGARIHSNSWGSDAMGAYTLDSVNADSFVGANRDLTITFSAGNSGIDANGDGIIDFDSIGSPATAKNVITVGASENDRLDDWACDAGLSYTTCASQGGKNTIFTYGAAWLSRYPANPIKDDPSAGNAEQMAAFSSRGPTDDGRIKPDVVAPGTWIVSGYSDKFQQGYDTSANPQNGAWQYDGWGFPRDQFYKYMGGTSMSNPIVAGGAAVVRDYYQTARGHSASAALVKANLINSAVDLLDENNSGVNNNAYPIPNMHEGWGRVDLAAAVQHHEFVESTAGLATGGSASYQFSVNGGPAFKVTLVWTDYPSTETAAKNLVNDLDLVVTGPGGAVYRGNVFSGGWSAAGGSPDRVNNVENVYVQSPASGTWTVHVNGFNVPNGSQPFALVIRGASAGGGAPTNTAPTAAALTITTDEDIAKVVTLSGSDAEQCELQFAIVSGPSNGTLSAITSPGNNCTAGTPNSDAATVTYTPKPDFHGSDSFIYRVSDGSLTSDATVNITVNPVNDAPVAADTSVTTASGSPVTVTLGATDVDGCETNFTFSVVNGPTGGTLGSISSVTCVAGTHTATVTYTPNDGLTGPDSFTYKANDGVADSNTATVSVDVTSSDPPPPATQSHVGDLDGSAANMGRGFWQGTVAIEVHDNAHTPVAGATVSGTWSGSFSGNASCTTGTNGRCAVTTGNIHNSNQTVTWTVGDVTHTSLSYRQTDNHDPDGDSDGTSITIRK